VLSEHGKQSFSGLALRRTLWNGTIMEEAAVNRSSFSVTPLSAHTGAEVATFHHHSVIAIRDQRLNAPQFS
jgi:hypothetical protein